MDALDRISVDRFSPVPLYHQVAQGIERAIRDGSLPVGSWLENEIELANRFGLSRPTMRRAIAELVEGGLLVRQRGVGTRVVSSAVARPVVLSSLFDDLTASGAGPSTRVLSLDLIEPDETLATEFGSTDPLWEILRLRSTHAGPLAVMHNWVPGSVTGLSVESLTENGLYALLRKAGAEFRVARQQIGARNADAEEAELLGLATGAACVTMRRTSYNGSGELLEIGEHLYRGDTYHFESTVVAR